MLRRGVPPLRRKTRILFLKRRRTRFPEVADIRALAKVAHQAGALLVVDNCFCVESCNDRRVGRRYCHSLGYQVS